MRQSSMNKEGGWILEELRKGWIVYDQNALFEILKDI